MKAYNYTLRAVFVEYIFDITDTLKVKIESATFQLHWLCLPRKPILV